MYSAFSTKVIYLWGKESSEKEKEKTWSKLKLLKVLKYIFLPIFKTILFSRPWEVSGHASTVVLNPWPFQRKNRFYLSVFLYIWPVWMYNICRKNYLNNIFVNHNLDKFAFPLIHNLDFDLLNNICFMP